MDNSEAAAEVTRKALIDNHASRNTPGMKIPLPQGQRESAAPYLGMKHPRAQANSILGSPEAFIKSPKPGGYLWRKRDDETTAAMISAQVMTPVEWPELNRSNPKLIAPVTELKTPSGDYVVWKGLALFHMSPAMWYEHYTANERYSKSLLAQHAAQFEEQVYEESRGTYKGVVRKDKEKEKTE
jgi:hypothetical protein